jgi:hypothetical protein
MVPPARSTQAKTIRVVPSRDDLSLTKVVLRKRARGGPSIRHRVPSASTHGNPSSVNRRDRDADTTSLDEVLALETEHITSAWDMCGILRERCPDALGVHTCSAAAC